MPPSSPEEGLFQTWIEKEDAYLDYFGMITQSGRAPKRRRPTQAEVYALNERGKEADTAIEQWLEERRR